MHIETAPMLVFSFRLWGFSDFMGCKKLYSLFFISRGRSIKMT